MKDSLTSIILCTKNEEFYIKDSIQKLEENIKNLEIIIVDDDSTDKTRDIINKINHNNRIKLIHRTKTKGLASAISSGLFHASGNYVGWIDTNMSELNFKFAEMKNLLDDNFDIVILSRYVEGGKDERVLIRSLCSKYFNLICRILLGSQIKDYTSGIFLMKKSIFNEVSFLPYGHGEFFIEFLENAKRKGFNIKEIPYTQIRDDDSKGSKTSSNLIKFLFLGFVYSLRIFITKIRRN